MKKLYTVKNNLRIPGLNINGPLTEPTEIDYLSVLDMVKAGYTVYQHNPYNLTSKVRVTAKNINTITFTASDGIREQAALARKKREQGKKYVDVVRKDKKQDDKKNNKFEKKNDKKFEPKKEFEANKEENKVTTSDFTQS